MINKIYRILHDFRIASSPVHTDQMSRVLVWMLYRSGEQSPGVEWSTDQRTESWCGMTYRSDESPCGWCTDQVRTQLR